MNSVVELWGQYLVDTKGKLLNQIYGNNIEESLR